MVTEQEHWKIIQLSGGPIKRTLEEHPRRFARAIISRSGGAKEWYSPELGHGVNFEAPAPDQFAQYLSGSTGIFMRRIGDLNVGCRCRLKPGFVRIGLRSGRDSVLR